MSKKDNKQVVNEYGAFLQIPISKIDRNEINKNLQAGIPDDAFIFSGIASDGELNRNGYIIRESAWEKALDLYMQNPIILFQHKDDKGIGNTLSAKVTKKGLEVTGFIFKDLDEAHTAGAIGKGVYRSLSTGHITKDFEMENGDTNEVLTKEAFKDLIQEMGWGEWMNDWTRVVTELEFVEWSIVAVGSNKAALKTNNTEREFLSRYFEIDTEVNQVDEEPEIVPAETPEPDAEAKSEEKVDSETPVEPEIEDEVETPVDKPTKETNAINAEEVKPEVNYVELLDKQENKITTLANAVIFMQNEVERLTKVVDNIPARKGLIQLRQFPEAKPEESAATSQVRQLFGKAGVKLK